MSNIRKATIDDAELIHSMIKELAEYERAPEKVTLELDQFIEDGFKENPLFETVILEHNGKCVGFALYFFRYSTWKGRSLYLEDLYVRPEARGNKLGLKVMHYLADIARRTSCGRFEWQVLDWNEPSIKFYQSLGAELDGEWINCRLEGADIANLAKQTSN